MVKALRELSVPSEIDEIFRVANRYRRTDAVTTYRILIELEKHELVSRMFTASGRQLFSLRTEQPRYFAVDRDTMELIDIDADTAAAVDRSARKIEELLAMKGYGEISHVVQFFVDQKPSVVRREKPRRELQFRSLRAIVEEIKKDFPGSDPGSVVHHPAFIALEKRARISRGVVHP